MKVQAAIAGLLLTTLGIARPAVAAEKPAVEKCTPSGELKFLCGLRKPEDLVPLPGGRWIIASGMTTNSGLHLIDAKTKQWERWVAPAVAAPKAPFEKCPSQSSPDELQLHGISLRDRGQGRATLYAVNHGGREPVEDMTVGRGRETIEVFDIDTTTAKPTLSWIGCVALPEKLVANSVVSASDGSIFATVMAHPGTSLADFWKGVLTGAVYKWTPGAAAFERVQGTELVGNNGIEISQDGGTLYVSSISGLTSFTNANPARRVTDVPIKDALVDNMHWVDGRLILAGPRTDLCPPTAPGVPCLKGYSVSALDTKTMAVTNLVKGPANPEFSGASFALPVGNMLWIGSYSDSKLAYRTLP